MYEKVQQYFGTCAQCGDCCTTPGIFLPHEIALLAEHLKLEVPDLFRTYLIAELFTPHEDSIPAFVVAPVKNIPDGKRDTRLLADARYILTRGAPCIFRNSVVRSCSIHDHKPFGCALLICSKMTKAKPLTLNKTYYYHRWLNSQEMLFPLFPGLGPLYWKLLDTVSSLPSSGAGRAAALRNGNDIISEEISVVMNGRRSTDRPFYQHREPV